MGKTRVCIVFGGRSGEHEVSVRSAESIYKAIDKTKYEASLLGMDKLGGWQLVDAKWLPKHGEMKALDQSDNRELTEVLEETGEVVFFPIIHGTGGEDGCIQGLLEIMNVAYVGAGVLGSALGMDKDVQKRLLKQAGIGVTDFVVIRGNKLNNEAEEFAEQSGYPVFVKPANMGSSVGVVKVNKREDLEKAVATAGMYDTKVMIEAGVIGRELEVAILGNNPYQASVVGEVVAHDNFYSYTAKYIDPDGAELVIPVENLSNSVVEQIRRTAMKSCEVLEVEGMARVDFFLREDGEILVNELNTLPGFTSRSMYPMLWQASGLSYSELIDKLIELAIARKNKRDDLVRSFSTD